jgi:anti-anti-sigma factor
MRIEQEKPGAVRILKLAGEFDVTDLPDVAERLDAVNTPGGVRIVLNLKEVRFANAAVLGSLVGARARLLREGGDLVLSSPSNFLHGVLRVLGLDQVIPAYRSDGAAIRHLRARTGARPHSKTLPQPCCGAA